MANDWQVTRPNYRCTATGREFAIGESFRAYLFEAPEGFVRRDFGLDVSPIDAPQALGAWQSRRPAPNTPVRPTIDADALFTFFERLADVAPEQEDKLRFRFALALLLWRKKLLSFEATEQDGEMEMWVFARPKVATRYKVLRPVLDESQIEQLSEQLERVLAGESSALAAAVPLTDEESDDV